MTNTCRFVPFKQAQSNHGLYTEHMYFSKQAYTYVLGYTLHTFSKRNICIHSANKHTLGNTYTTENL